MGTPGQNLLQMHIKKPNLTPTKRLSWSSLQAGTTEWSFPSSMLPRSTAICPKVSAHSRPLCCPGGVELAAASAWGTLSCAIEFRAPSTPCAHFLRPAHISSPLKLSPTLSNQGFPADLQQSRQACGGALKVLASLSEDFICT